MKRFIIRKRLAAALLCCLLFPAVLLAACDTGSGKSGGSSGTTYPPQALDSFRLTDYQEKLDALPEALKGMEVFPIDDYFDAKFAADIAWKKVYANDRAMRSLLTSPSALDVLHDKENDAYFVLADPNDPAYPADEIKPLCNVILRGSDGRLLAIWYEMPSAAEEPPVG